MATLFSRNIPASAQIAEEIRLLLCKFADLETRRLSSIENDPIDYRVMERLLSRQEEYMFDKRPDLLKRHRRNRLEAFLGRLQLLSIESRQAFFAAAEAKFQQPDPNIRGIIRDRLEREFCLLRLRLLAFKWELGLHVDLQLVERLISAALGDGLSHQEAR